MTDFSSKIIDWYAIHKRDLPWRDTTDPYKIWLSEIILQQTRVDQGYNYYLKFIKHYPTIVDLANASEQQVLNDWQGLGYYSRARNLHVTAKIVAMDFGGKFPTSYEEIIKLKGIGPYTAAAIASFAFREVKALVDGNVYRVLSRYFDIATPIDSAIGKKTFQQLADQLISTENPDVHNQAIMEFGSQQCVPVRPNCNVCVLQNNCQSLLNDTVALRPVKQGKIKVRKRYFYYLLFEEGSKICVQKRESNKDIWQHLYEFPLLEYAEQQDLNDITELVKRDYGIEVTSISNQVSHILSHQKLLVHFIHCDGIPHSMQSLTVDRMDLSEIPLPRLIDRYLEQVWS